MGAVISAIATVINSKSSSSVDLPELSPFAVVLIFLALAILLVYAVKFMFSVL